MNKLWTRTALANFVLIAGIGALLRFAFVRELPWMDYMNLLHAHSHGALLGWAYLALFAALTGAFLPPARRERPAYAWLFWTTQFAVAGMLITFPIGGYFWASTAFSTLHVLLAIAFAYRFLRDLRRLETQARFSVGLARAAVFFMLLSIGGILAIGPVMATVGKGTIWYYMTVQFFLHFQINGWLFFGILALFFRMLERRRIELPARPLRLFFRLFVAATFLTYALAVAWASPDDPVFVVNSAGVLVQLAAVAVLLRLLWKRRRPVAAAFPSLVRRLLGIAAACLLGKVLIQTAVVIPYIATVAYTVRNFVIGFIHLVLLGVISTFLLGYSFQRGGLRATSRLAKTGVTLFLLGFAGSEALLFLQGALFWAAMGFMPVYYEALFVASALLPLGLLLLFLAQFGRQQTGQAPAEFFRYLPTQPD